MNSKQLFVAQDLQYVEARWLRTRKFSRILTAVASLTT